MRQTLLTRDRVVAPPARFISVPDGALRNHFQGMWWATSLAKSDSVGCQLCDTKQFPLAQRVHAIPTMLVAAHTNYLTMLLLLDFQYPVLQACSHLPMRMHWCACKS